MGQRLVITIKDGDNVLAAGYYHWSAYTSSSLELALHCLNTFKATKKVEKLDIALEMLYETGAGIEPESVDAFMFACNRNPFLTSELVHSVDRNIGLIAVGDENIAEMQTWSEGDVRIDIGNKTIDFTVFGEATIDEYLYDYLEVDIEGKTDEEKKELIKDIPRINMDYLEIPFNDFPEFAKKIYNLDAFICEDEGFVCVSIA